jgi:hypothetical protein
LTSPYVNKASNWLIFVKGPIRGFVYIWACEFQYELLNFTTKFGTKFATFAEKLYEINCNPGLTYISKHTSQQLVYKVGDISSEILSGSMGVFFSKVVNKHVCKNTQNKTAG